MKIPLLNDRVNNYCYTVMKYSTITLCILIAFCSLVMAKTTYGQKILRDPVNIEFKQTPLLEALEKITAQTKVKFVYQSLDAYKAVRITKNFKHEKLGTLLEQMLLDNDISFSVIDNVVILKPGQKALSRNVKDIEVRGIVTDSTGVGLPGVSVTVKGKKGYGAITDMNGNYLIRVPENTILVFNFVGFIPAEFAVKDHNYIAIRLKEDKTQLENVVIVGYGTQKKTNVTGAVASVSTSELLRTPTASLTNSLAGRLPGLVTIQESGEPGADGATLFIRGFGTYQGKNPLILVDGIENAIDRIDANEVENVSILKDAAATAVYGMKGANGVVLVTTKRGKTGKPVISLTSQVAMQEPVRLPEYLNSFDALTLFREALNNDGLNANLYTDEYLNKFRDRSNPTYQYLYPNVDWDKELLKSHSMMKQTNLNVNGGSSTARYFVSMSYLGQDGLYKYDNLNDYNINASLNKYNFRSNIDIDITPLLSMELNLSDVVRDRNYPTETSGTFWAELRNTPPYLYPLSNPDGSVTGQKNGPASPYGRLTQFGYKRFFENTLSAIAGFSLKMPFITPGLTFRTRFAFDAQNNRNINRKRSYSTYRYIVSEDETDLSKGTLRRNNHRRRLAGF